MKKKDTTSDEGSAWGSAPAGRDHAARTSNRRSSASPASAPDTGCATSTSSSIRSPPRCRRSSRRTSGCAEDRRRELGLRPAIGLGIGPGSADDAGRPRSTRSSGGRRVPAGPRRARPGARRRVRSMVREVRRDVAALRRRCVADREPADRAGADAGPSPEASPVAMPEADRPSSTRPRGPLPPSSERPSRTPVAVPEATRSATTQTPPAGRADRDDRRRRRRADPSRRAATRALRAIRRGRGGFPQGAVLGRGVTGAYPAFLRVTITRVPSSIPSSRNPSSVPPSSTASVSPAISSRGRPAPRRARPTSRCPARSGRSHRARPPCARPGPCAPARAPGLRGGARVTSSSSATVTPPSDATPHPDHVLDELHVLGADRDRGPPVHRDLDRVAVDQTSRERAVVVCEAAPRPCTRGPSRGPSTLKSGFARQRRTRRPSRRGSTFFTLSSSATMSRSASNDPGADGAPPPRRAAGGCGSWSPSDPPAELDHLPRRRHRLVETGVERPSWTTGIVREVHGVRPTARAAARFARSPRSRTA